MDANDYKSSNHDIRVLMLGPVLGVPINPPSKSMFMNSRAILENELKVDFQKLESHSHGNSISHHSAVVTMITYLRAPMSLLAGGGHLTALSIEPDLESFHWRTI